MFSKRVKIFFNIYLLIKFFCHCRLVLNPSFAGSSSGFGNGFLLTPMASNGLTYANVVDGAPGVVQNIFLSVLNGSKFLHETSNIESATKSVYFFAKKTGTSSDIAEALMASDMEAVNRLEGKYTVAVRPLKQRGKKFIDLLKFRFFMKATKHLRKKLI